MLYKKDYEVAINIQLDNICTINQAKIILGLSYQSTLNLILQNKIEAEKIGWGWAIDKSSLIIYKKQKRILDRKKARINKRKSLNL